MKHHWYFITVVSCVLCGRTHIYRERRYSKRPDKYEHRHEYVEDACGCHFL